MNKIGSANHLVNDSKAERENHEQNNQSPKKAAQKLLENGILVERKNGLVCMSLKDALSSKMDGYCLSVKELQAIANQLLYRQEIEKKSEDTSNWNENIIIKEMKSGFTVERNTDETNKKFSPVLSEWNSITKDNEKEQSYSFSQTPFTLKAQYFHTPLNKETFSKYNIKSSSRGIKTNEASLNEKHSILNNNVKSVMEVQNILKNLSDKKNMTSDIKNLMVHSGFALIKTAGQVKNAKHVKNFISCKETFDNCKVTSASLINSPGKKRGGWPKGRKRKPESKCEIRPPKAPATGYIIFLNERRKEFRDIPFTEVTKLLGNEWSRLSLEEKRVYLDQAEVEKKRYREELRLYRQSDAYQFYLNKKRLKRIQANGTEESDRDATDEINDEDNEELYCRSCDQWFHSLHNKKEHLYGRQHLQSLGCGSNKVSDPELCNANMSSTPFDESSLDGSSYLRGSKELCCHNKGYLSLNMADAMVRFMIANQEREEERVILKRKLFESKAKNQTLTTNLQHLNEIIEGLTCMAESERTTQILLEQRLFNLLNVPTLFYLPDPLNEGHTE